MSTIAIEPEVAEFLTAVRTHLADLDPEEQRDILDGLEADLTELVAEQGPEALGDPHAYALELRAAAGIGESTRHQTRPIRASVDAFLDACRARFDALLGRLPWDPAPLLAWARPLWWVVRAWLAIQLVDMITRGYSGGAEVLPHLGGFGWLVLGGAVALSVQMGRGVLWPGGKRGVPARLVLIALNAAAVVVAIPVVDALNNDQRFWDGYQQGIDEAQADGIGYGTPLEEQAGVYSNGQWVSNIYPYDAEGRPLVGVQLFDQTGKPIKVVTQPDCEISTTDPAPPVSADENGWMGYCADQGYDPVAPRVFYPWTNGAAQLFNVFPLPSRFQAEPEPTATAFSEKDEPAVGAFPLATVPPASLPGIKTGVQKPAR